MVVVVVDARNLPTQVLHGHLYSRGYQLSSGYDSDRNVRHKLALILAELPLTTVFFSRVPLALPRQLAGAATLELVSLRTCSHPPRSAIYLS
jgi:hypothetical protein